MSNLFIVSGPSGAGEDSIIEGLAKLMPLERVITTTTREMRPNESTANPYYFISHNEFQKKISENEMVEYAQEYNNNFYGVTIKELERVNTGNIPGIWKIEYKGVMTAKKLFPNIIAILINAPLKTLEKRIRERDNVTEEFIKERIDYTKEWLKHKDIYDYTINNIDGKLKESITELKNFIEKNQ